MRLPFVSRSELEVVRAEREAWRRRAEAVRVASAEQPLRRRGRLLAVPLATGALALGTALGVAVAPSSSHGVSRPDYPGCIGRARYEAPIADNQYQELVNALYACGVYAYAGPAGG